MKPAPQYQYSVITISHVFTITVAHHTGNVSKLAKFLVERNGAGLGVVGGSIGLYALGACCSGLLVGDHKFRLGRRYGYALALESIALAGSWYYSTKEITPVTVDDWQFLGVLLAAWALGLQNAMTTQYSGAVVRTTHMTGIITDIGNLLGQGIGKLCFKQNTTPEFWRLKIHIPLLLNFFLGGILGEIAYDIYQIEALLAPAVLIASLALLYILSPVVKIAEDVLTETAKKQAELMKLLPHLSLHLPHGFHQNPNTSAATAAAAAVVAVAALSPHDVSANLSNTDVDARILELLRELETSHSLQQISPTLPSNPSKDMEVKSPQILDSASVHGKKKKQGYSRLDNSLIDVEEIELNSSEKQV